MNMYDIIYKKREGGKLSREEIDFFVEGYTEGAIPDYQASALLMAIFFRGMDKEETYQLTDAMRSSGDVVDLSAIKGIKVDKHSTGGVGDKTTFIVGPLAAAVGVPIAKMSGRGLGFTGGTVDKMESIPGLRTALSPEAFIDLVNRIGLAIIGQTAHVAPADKKIYALRDVTATVENLSLITSSIMSKKLASGSDAIVLDVKCGDGAFMKNEEDACRLGKLMVEMGRAAGKATVAVVTDMTQPLGYAVGNSLEVIEAIETLKGRGPADITELSLVLAGAMIWLGKKAACMEEGREKAEEALKSGAALEKMRQWIAGQGGDDRVIEDYSLFPQARYQVDIPAPAIVDETKYIKKINARKVGLVSQHAGAGRETKDAKIDLSAGILLRKKAGDAVNPGDVLATVFSNDKEKAEKAASEAAATGAFAAFSHSDFTDDRPLIVNIISAEQME